MNIGSWTRKSHSEKSPSATIPEGFYCPNVIDNTLWLEGGYGSEQFKVTQNGTKVSVARIDSAIPYWEMDLKFHCCKNDGMVSKIVGHNISLLSL